jgi:6-pyruvoyltetrahydropterin/6-carboxytetrahydropterin synthase
LHRYDGACANIHGHSYRLEATVVGPIATDTASPKCGMIMDFGDLKRVVQTTVLDKVDHALVLNSAMKNDENVQFFASLQNGFGNIVWVDYQPTNENLLQDFATRIQSELPDGITLVKLRMYETNASFAEWTV